MAAGVVSRSSLFTRVALAVFSLFALSPLAEVRAAAWDETLAKAKGKSVYFNAWAGDENTNRFIAWVGEQVKARYGVELVHVKIKLTSETVSRVVAEKAAGKVEGGSVDLVWINGENFLAMKEQGLLHGPFTEKLPNFRLVDTTSKPTLIDFTVPVDGLEVPWRMAQIVFVHDAARTPNPPRSMRELAEWAKKNPGRVTHPQIRNFLGSTFMKQALYELAPDPSVLSKPATDESFAAATKPLWAWYEGLKPNLWRGGRQFPESGPAQRQLLTDGELDLYIAFNPAEAAVGVAAGTLPKDARAYVLSGGTIGNASFVAIPFNAANKEAAMVVANFLLSPESQAKGMRPDWMGNATVLDMAKLSPEERKLFDDIPKSPALPTLDALGRPLPEPHPSWMNRIVDEWLKRYAS